MCFLFFSVFSLWAGVYRDPEEAAAVMETAGAETLSVFPSEIPPGAVRLSAAEEVRSGLGRGERDREGCGSQRGRKERLKWNRCLPRRRDGFCWIQRRIHGREEGWESFRNKIPGVGWGGRTAVKLGREDTVLVCVVGAYPSDSHHVSLALNPVLPSCAASPQHWAGSLPACCPLLITSALEVHQKAINRQKKKA